MNVEWINVDYNEVINVILLFVFFFEIHYAYLMYVLCLLCMARLIIYLVKKKKLIKIFDFRGNYLNEFFAIISFI